MMQPLSEREIKYYERLITWWDSNREGDFLTMESAHELGSIVALGKIRLGTHRRKEARKINIDE